MSDPVHILDQIQARLDEMSSDPAWLNEQLADLRAALSSAAISNRDRRLLIASQMAAGILFRVDFKPVSVSDVAQKCLLMGDALIAASALSPDEIRNSALGGQTDGA